MRRAMAVLVGLLILGHIDVLAAENTAREEQVAKLGAKRAVVTQKMLELQKLLEINTVETGCTSINIMNVKIAAAAAKVVQEETAKALELQNIPVLIAANRRTQKNTEMLSEYNNTALPALRAKWADITKAYAVVNVDLFPKIAGMDQAWISAELDTEVLIALLDVIGKRADELKARVLSVNEEADKVLANWTAFAKG